MRRSRFGEEAQTMAILREHEAGLAIELPTAPALYQPG